jgi:glucosamine 6-phosphate synthetase-like amidotransferase/phosphosugar isomerase protein
MPETVFGDIVVNALVLVDFIVNQFVTGTTYTTGNLLTCTPSSYTGGSLTACGTALVSALAVEDIIEALAELSMRAVSLVA